MITEIAHLLDGQTATSMTDILLDQIREQAARR